VTDIPSGLLVGLTPSAEDVARDWWNKLPDAARADVIALYEPPQAPNSPHRIIGGRILSDDEAAGWREWMAEYFEHLVAQPDSNLVDPPFIRTFYIG
jgi:hypothetical protein